MKYDYRDIKENKFNISKIEDRFIYKLRKGNFLIAGQGFHFFQQFFRESRIILYKQKSFLDHKNIWKLKYMDNVDYPHRIERMDFIFKHILQKKNIIFNIKDFYSDDYFYYFRNNLNFEYILLDEKYNKIFSDLQHSWKINNNLKVLITKRKNDNI